MRSLTPSNNLNLNSYEVLKPFSVQSSLIAPAYGQPGDGIEYRLPQNVDWLIKNGYIKNDIFFLNTIMR